MHFAAALLVPALLAFQTVAHASARDDAAVQTLASVPALAKLAERGDRAVEAHLRKVGRIYTRAGYRKTGAAIRTVNDALCLFAVSDNDLHSSRAALRDLGRALAAETTYLTPATPGDRLPNYRDLAVVFHDNARAVLKNVRRGLPPTRKLDRRKGTLWLTRMENGTVVPGGSYGGSVINDHNPNWGGAKVAIFPPGVELPPTANVTVSQTLEEPDVIGGVEFPAGSRVVTVAAGFVLPEGVGLWSEGLVFLPGNLPVTLADDANVIGKADTRWIAFPPDTALPANPLRTTLHVGFSCEANGVLLQSGAVIRERHKSFDVPEGAIDLGGPYLEITRLDG